MPYIGNVPKYGDTVDNFKQLDSISSYTLSFDASSVVNVTTNKFTAISHRFLTGQKVTYNKGGIGGSAIGGLADGSYYIIRDGNNTFRLASSASNASAATAIDITSVGNGTQTLNVSFDGYNTTFKPTWGAGENTVRLTSAAQLILSMNGVIQKPDATGASGFKVVDGNIIFSVAPSSTDVFWGNVIGDRISSFDITDNHIDNFTGTGTKTEFNLSRLVPSNESLLVTIDGVTQYPSDNQSTRSYSVLNGNSLTFTSAPSLGSLIQARHIGFVGGGSGGSGGVTSLNGRTGPVTLQSGDPGVGVGINSTGTNIGYGVTQINFVGTGNTFKYNSSTDTVDVSIEGGGGTSAGTRINYPDGTKSPFMLSMAHITQNMTLNDTTTGEDLDCNLVIAESQMVIDAGIGLTIGDGKKVLTDLYDIYQ